MKKLVMFALLMVASVSALAGTNDALRQFGLVGEFGTTCHKTTPNEGHLVIILGNPTVAVSGYGNDQHTWQILTAEIVSPDTIVVKIDMDNGETIRTLTVKKFPNGKFRTMVAVDNITGKTLLTDGNHMPYLQPCYTAN